MVSCRLRLIEGCTLFGKRPTEIEDNVWLVGSCTVSSGIILKKNGIFLTGSNITKNTEVGKVYSGVPARVMEKVNFYKSISLNDKLEMMYKWATLFTGNKKELTVKKESDSVVIENILVGEKLHFIIVDLPDQMKSVRLNNSFFSLKSKKYTKNLSDLEIEFYRYLYNHKARFIPENG